MNREDIIRMAREAGMDVLNTSDWGPIITAEPADLERFASLVVAHEREVRSMRWDELIVKAVEAEREACAKTVEDDGLAYSFSSITYGRHLAEQIRARSNAE